MNNRDREIIGDFLAGLYSNENYTDTPVLEYMLKKLGDEKLSKYVAESVAYDREVDEFEEKVYALAEQKFHAAEGCHHIPLWLSNSSKVKSGEYQREARAELENRRDGERED